MVLPIIPFLLKLASTGFSLPASQEKISALTQEKAAFLRVELLMTLDLFVKAQRALKEETTMFTQALDWTPPILGYISHYYRIEVVRASRNYLLITAEGGGPRNGVFDSSSVQGDRIVVDKLFKVRANFPIPNPPRGYLHTLAQTVMNRVFIENFVIPKRDVLDQWEGIFKRYFQYEVRTVSSGGRTIVAIGQQSPVQGDIVEMSRGANLFEWVHHNRHATGSKYEAAAKLENIYFAAKIYNNHVGSYAANFNALIPSWNSLESLVTSRAHFFLQDFRADPTFGYHAEILQRSTESHSKSWGINGYAQIFEVPTMEHLLQEIQQAQRRIATHGQRATPVNPAEKQASKPLLIDTVENEGE